MNRILLGDCRESLRTLPALSVNCVVTSPPYFGLRDYGVDGQLGLEPTPAEFVADMVEVFREVGRVLRDDGTLWLNLGDSYAGSRAGPQGKSGQMADRSVAAARCRSASTNMLTRGKRDAKRWGGGNNPAVGGLKPKDLIGIPWRVAFALQDDGWFLRQDIVWSKPNAMPESVRDRCTRSHEYIFMFSKSPKYHFDHEAIKEPAVSDHSSGNGFKRPARKSYQNLDGSARGNEEKWTGVGGLRNRRSVWNIATQPFKEAHFATYPPKLIEPCILAGCPIGGTVLDPFFGAGTTGLVAQQNGRNWIGCELNSEYAEIASRRLGISPVACSTFDDLLGHNGGPAFDDILG